MTASVSVFWITSWVSAIAGDGLLKAGAKNVAAIISADLNPLAVLQNMKSTPVLIQIDNQQWSKARAHSVTQGTVRASYDANSDYSLVLLDYGYSHVPINALTYGIIVDNPLSLHDAVMSFVNAEHIVTPDADLPHHSAA